MDGLCIGCGAACRAADRFCSQCGRRDPLVAELTVTAADRLAVTVGATPRRPDAPTLAPGTVFARRYRIERLLGEGGMGRVYLAVDGTIYEPIALKVLASSFQADTAALEQFKRELKLARRVRHRNVVASFHLAEWNGQSYITQEYIDADNLSTYLDHHGPLAEPEALRLLRQVVRGLKAAHDLGIVHRDIKAGNILVNREGTAFITDFGLASSAAQRGELKGAGTPRYMAPELFEGADATPASDFYACGVLLFLLLTGQYPVTGRDYAEFHEAHRAGSPAPIPADVTASPATRNLYTRLVATRPADRPQHAGEVLDVIDGVLAFDALKIQTDRPIALVADADGPTRQLASEALGRQGYHVETLTTADELVTRAFALTPALIVVSASVEGEGIVGLSTDELAVGTSEPAAAHRALSLCRLLRQDTRLKAVPLLVLAQTPHPAVSAAFRLVGASEVLAKPFTADAFSAGVQRARQHSVVAAYDG